MDEQPKKKPLSEIGHLFLSSVRERQLGGMPLPQRTPPGGTPPATQPHGPQPLHPPTHVSINLTPEELARAFGGADASEAHPARRTSPVTAVIGEHLNGKQLSRVKEYARHLAAGGQRIGLIELDASEFRLMCFEPGDATSVPPASESSGDCYDARAMAEAIEEMSFDVDRWLLLMPSPRVPEAQPLLRLVDHWLLLSTCDHDGVVSSYRMLKGLIDLHRPRLSLAVLDALDVGQADKVHKKLAGVCQQFLDRILEPEPPVRKVHQVCEHLVMLCQPTRDKAQLANPPQWEIVGEFLTRMKPPVEADAQRDVPHGTAASVAPREIVAEVVVPQSEGAGQSTSFTLPPFPQPAGQPGQDATIGHDAGVASAPAVAIGAAMAGAAAGRASLGTESVAEVVDLPTSDASAEQIVDAVLKRDGSALLECPVRPPMCADARLAVTRDRHVVLLAVAGRGLAELNAIGQAYRWLIENRSLIGMAVPQLSIDPTQAPRLRLLVEQRDAGAQILQPMLAGEHVAVQSYRRVTWAGKAGLLLEAA